MQTMTRAEAADKLIDRYADFTDLTEVFFDMNGKDGRDSLMQTQIEHKEQKAK